MGALQFFAVAQGRDVHLAFHAACDHARHEDGSAGYTGTIAEKSKYVIITDQPQTYREAARLARELLHACDPRIDSTWGPAGAIAIDDVPGCDEPGPGWLFFGWASW